MIALLVACAGGDGAPDRADTGGDSGEMAAEYVDVLVIGAGVAGLSAAIFARDAFEGEGSVLVLEREAEAGGAANLAGGRMLFSGTPEQDALGVEDSPERLTAEWTSFTGGDTADPWFDYFAANNVAKVHDWLAGLGLSWPTIDADESSGGVRRIHNLGGEGPALVAALLEQLPAEMIRYEAQADELIVEAGGVTGVRWTDLASGESGVITATRTVVATGGFLYDVERVRSLVPEAADADIRSGAFRGADGNGHDMLVAVGAATQNLSAVGFYAHGVPSPDDPLGEYVSEVIGEWPAVNLDGERFYDDSQMNSFIFGRTRAEQAGGDVWMVADHAVESAVFLDPSDPEDFRAVDSLVAAGVALQAESVSALAGEMGVDATVLDRELSAWNAAWNGEQPDEWREEPGDHPVGAPPFYALPIAATAAKQFGGIDVDLHGQVLDTAGKPIQGLYAAGELTGMLGGSIVGDFGFTGSLTAVVLGGRVAGENAGEGLGYVEDGE